VKKFTVSDLAYLFVLVLFVLISRLPGLLSPMLNSDEAYFLASAIKLLKEPIFWRDVNTTTSGPLNIYPLLIPAIFGLKLEYAAGRLVGLFAVCVSLCCLYLSLTALYRKQVVRPTLLFPVVTFALFTATEFIHYTSEHISVMLITVILMMITRMFKTNDDKKISHQLFVIGLVIGMTPYAKLQCLPISFCLFCIAAPIQFLKVFQNKLRLQRIGFLVVGSLSFSILVAFLLICFSTWGVFWHSYILQNVFFSGIKSSIGEKIQAFIGFVRAYCPLELYPLIKMTLYAGMLGIPILLASYVNISKNNDNNRRKQGGALIFVFYSVMLVLCATISVAQPQRPFAHYILFLIPSIIFLLGVITGELDAISKENRGIYRFSLTVKFLLLMLGCIYTTKHMINIASSGNPYLQKRNIYVKNYFDPVSRAILTYASPGDSMAIWGWSPWLFVETGLLHAGLDNIPLWAFRPNPQHDYYVHQFVDGMRESRARLFLDVMVPGNLGYEWLGTKGIRYEDIPELRDYVQREFTMVQEINGVKIYTRKMSLPVQ
jgi:hypothetical protein